MRLGARRRPERGERGQADGAVSGNHRTSGLRAGPARGLLVGERAGVPGGTPGSDQTVDIERGKVASRQVSRAVLRRQGEEVGHRDGGRSHSLLQGDEESDIYATAQQRVLAFDRGEGDG